MSAALQKKGPASVGALPDHGSTNTNQEISMNEEENSTWYAPRSIDPVVLSNIRDELYHTIALCEALRHALFGVGVANGIPELLQTKEHGIDVAAERIQVLTIPQTGTAHE